MEIFFLFHYPLTLWLMVLETFFGNRTWDYEKSNNYHHLVFFEELQVLDYVNSLPSMKPHSNNQDVSPTGF